MPGTEFRADQSWFKQLFELSPDPTWIIDGNRFVECNDAAIRTLGYASREEFLDVHPSRLSPPKQADGQDSYVKAEEMMAIAMEKGLHRFEWTHTRADGTDFLAEVTLSRVELHERPVIYCVWRDITERKRMEEQVRQLAFYDTLTKLPNRRLLDDRLSLAMAAGKRSGCYGSLMFLDLDNFKPINDTHGHAVGDLLLIEAADRLKACVRGVDTVARFGGDEFVIMLSELNRDRAESIQQAEAVAEKIRTRLSEPYRLKVRHAGMADADLEHHCTVSIGVAMFLNYESDHDDLLRWADTAMYQAKESGRNSIRFYPPSA